MNYLWKQAIRLFSAESTKSLNNSVTESVEDVSSWGQFVCLLSFSDKYYTVSPSINEHAFIFEDALSFT